jgi:hypothetical protein
LSWREVRELLHEELGRLPQRLRDPLLLCYLQGRTQGEAAAELGVPTGTLRNRLERGRALLRARLARRGLGPAVALLAAYPAGATAGIPPSAVQSAVRAACAPGDPTASAAVITLAEGVLNVMFRSKLKAVCATVLVGVLLATGAGVATLAGTGGGDPPQANGFVPVPKAGENPDGRGLGARDDGGKRKLVLPPNAFLPPLDLESRIELYERAYRAQEAAASLGPNKMLLTLEKVTAGPDGKSRSISGAHSTLGAANPRFQPLKLENLVVSDTARITERGKEIRFTDLKPRTIVWIEIAPRAGTFVVVAIAKVGPAK